jgi:prevent-host-death family protein
MDETISAAEANRRFSHLLQGVREGRSYVVTSHGKPLARLTPASAHQPAATSARERLFAHLSSQAPVNAPKWTRDELYEDDG